MQISPYCDQIEIFDENETWVLADALNDLMMSGSYSSRLTAHVTIVKSARIAGFDPFTASLPVDEWVNAIVAYELSTRYAN